MIQFERLRIYDKRGSDLQWFPTSSISVEITSVQGKGAILYPYLNPDNTSIGGVYIKNGGFGYGTYESIETDNKVEKINGIVSFIESCYIKYNDIYIGEIPIDKIIYGAINYNDSLGEHKSLYIKGVDVDGIKLYDITNLETPLVFPTLTFTCALYTDKVSTSLVETEHIHLFYQHSDTSLVNIYDTTEGVLTLSTSVGDSEIKLFEVDSIDNSVCWCESVEHIIPNSPSHAYPISFNIGFTSEDEGVYENEINLYYNNSIIASFIINSESIGEDERFRTLLSNFNIPDPKNFSHVLKDSDLKESNPNWELINQKSKQFMLEYDNIFKYCGTYKGLVNAVKLLGYSDIYFREWFMDTKTSTRKTFRVAYGTDKNNIDTIKTIPFSERKTLKKLNTLSMVYQLNRLTGEYDEYNIPIVENVYNSDIKDIRVKMGSLKKWLEKNIIGVNCKISDITAEGVYFDSYDNRIGSNYNQTFELDEIVELTPYVKDNKASEVDLSTIINMDVNSSAILKLSVLETNDGYIKTNDIGHLSANDFVSGGASNPLRNINDYMWRANIKTKSNIIDESIATNGLWVYNNTIRIKSMIDSIKSDGDNESVFITPYLDENGVMKGNKISVAIEHCYLRDIQTHEIVYSIVPIRTLINDIEVEKIDVDIESGDVITYTDYVNKDIVEYALFKHEGDNTTLISKEDTYFILKTFDYTNIQNGTKTIFRYAENDKTKSHSLFIDNFELWGGKQEFEDFKSSKYVLEIIDGKIACEPIDNVSDNYITTYINFNYDEKINEQTIECNLTYTSPRLSYNNQESGIDYEMIVNHCGDYKIELLTWNDCNILFINNSPYGCYVYQSKPQVDKFINYLEDNDNESHLNIDLIDDYPIYDRPVLYQVKDVIGSNGDFSVITESYSYMHKIPYVGAYVSILDKQLGNYKDIGIIVDNIIYNHTVSIKSIITTYGTGLVFTSHIPSYNVGDVININIAINEEGDSSKIIFSTSCTARIAEKDGNIILFKDEIIPIYMNTLLSKNMCVITTSPAWINIDNIKNFRIEQGSEYDFNGNKLMLDFKNDNYILPYIDSNFDLSIEDFDVSYVKENWLSKDEIINILSVDTLYNIDNQDIILKPRYLDKSNMYIWYVYTESDLIYKVYNNLASFKYEPNITYNVNLDVVDKYGNISSNKLEGLIKIKETV